MRRIVAYITIIAMAFSLTGCASLQKKFTRKKKQEKKMPRMYQTKKYEKKPTPELYQKHYVYWMTWQSEAISDIGQNSKRDKVFMTHILSNLRDMQNILVKEKGDELGQHIKKLESVRDTVLRDEVNAANRSTLIQVLEREDRFIKREFKLAKVKSYLKISFDESEEEAEDAEETDTDSPASSTNKETLAVTAPSSNLPPETATLTK